MDINFLELHKLIKDSRRPKNVEKEKRNELSVIIL